MPPGTRPPFPRRRDRIGLRHADSEASERVRVHPASTLAWVAVCRDEIAGTLLAEVEAVWGASFSFASLAGLPTAGRTGFSAGQQFVAFSMPHIAISADGVIGEIRRPGLTLPSKACGALPAFRDELARGTLAVSLDPFDIEQSYLKQRLLSMIEYGTVPDVVELTSLTADAIERDSRSILQDMLEEIKPRVRTRS